MIGEQQQITGITLTTQFAIKETCACSLIVVCDKKKIITFCEGSVDVCRPGQFFNIIFHYTHRCYCLFSLAI